MKKQTKKLLLVFGFVAVAAIAFAGPVVISCEDGSRYNYLSLKDVGTLEWEMDVAEAVDALCN